MRLYVNIVFQITYFNHIGYYAYTDYSGNIYVIRLSLEADGINISALLTMCLLYFDYCQYILSIDKFSTKVEMFRLRISVDYRLATEVGRYSYIGRSMVSKFVIY